MPTNCYNLSIIFVNLGEITIDSSDVTFDDIKKLIELVPKDVKLTFVGGQAINFWATYFHEIYPKKFIGQEGLVFGTQDIDIVANSKAALCCYEAWKIEFNAKINIPDIEDHTVNSAIITIHLAEKGDITIDFLTDYVRPNNSSKLKNELFKLSDSKPIYILSPFATLLAKIGNTLVLKRTHSHALGQLRAAILINQCYIMELLENNSKSEASQIIKSIIKLTTKNNIGGYLYQYHNIDLLNILPENLDTLDPRFIEKSLKPELAKILSKREV